MFWVLQKNSKAEQVADGWSRNGTGGHEQGASHVLGQHSQVMRARGQKQPFSGQLLGMGSQQDLSKEHSVWGITCNATAKVGKKMSVGCMCPMQNGTVRLLGWSEALQTGSPGLLASSDWQGQRQQDIWWGEKFEEVE